jgi:hypothetical protein
MSKRLLDFVCGGAAASAPSERWVGLAWGTPTHTGGSEISSTYGYTRMSATFNAAASPDCSASLAAPMTWASLSSACSILGVTLWDGSGTDASMLLGNTLQTARTPAAGDSFYIPTGGITIILS